MGNGAAARAGCDPAKLETFCADAQASILALDRENSDLRQRLLEAEKRVAELQSEAREDALTGLLNRRGIDEELGRAMDLVKRYDATISVLFADLDRFKKVNDEYGHAIGDMALKHVSALFRSHIRRSDFIARIGGDEFALVLWQTDQTMAEAKADSLSNLIAATPLCLDGARIDLAVSIGAAEIFREDVSPGSILARADKAMYAVKDPG